MHCNVIPILPLHMYLSEMMAFLHTSRKHLIKFNYSMKYEKLYLIHFNLNIIHKDK